MGVNVFGTPVTVSSVKLMEKYRNRDATITRHDLAKVAMEQKNAGEKVVLARNTMKQLKDELKSTDNNIIITMCLVYNATGDPVRFHSSRELAGSLYESHYPIIIANGQWGAFLHRSSCGGTKTAGVFTYQGNNSYGRAVHCVTAFAACSTSKSKIRMEIKPPTELSTLNNVYLKFTGANYCYLGNTEGAAMYGCIGDIGDGDTSMLEVVLTLPGVVDS